MLAHACNAGVGFCGGRLTSVLFFVPSPLTLMFSMRKIPMGQTSGWIKEGVLQTRTQSLFMCFGGERWLGVRLRLAQGLMGRDEGIIATLPMRPRARLNLTPNLLSPQKHIHSDWVRVWGYYGRSGNGQFLRKCFSFRVLDSCSLFNIGPMNIKH